MEEQKLGDELNSHFMSVVPHAVPPVKKSKLEIGRVVSACSRHDKQSKSVKGVDKK